MITNNKFALCRLLFVILFSTMTIQLVADDHNTVEDWQQMPNWLELKDGVNAAYYKDGNSFGKNLSRLNSAMRLAMFTAANATNPRYTQYLTIDNNTNANANYAAGIAAAEVMALGYGKKYVGDDVRTYLEKLAVGLSDVTVQASKELGIMSAKAAIERARMQVQDNYPHYKPQTSAGVYITAHLPAFPPRFLDSKPWFIESRDAIRPEAPPALNSELWARDFNEVKSYGRKTESKRTEHQSKEATLWAGQDNEILIDQAAASRNLDLLDILRIYSMLSMSTDDSFLAVVEAKYHYNFWRPITAIRRAELDNNQSTAIDAGWEPYKRTPNHPEYPCAHCQYGAGTAAILESLVPRQKGEQFKVYDKKTPEDYTLITEYKEFEKRMSDSRIYYGAHFRTSNEVGERMGRNVASIALEKFAVPLEN